MIYQDSFGIFSVEKRQNAAYVNQSADFGVFGELNGFFDVFRVISETYRSVVSRFTVNIG